MSKLDFPANSSSPLKFSFDDSVIDLPKKESTNIYVLILIVSVTIAILVLNGYIIGLTKYYSRILKKSFSLHILSLSFTDFAVGLSGIPFIYNYTNQHEMDYGVCASIFGTYIICQVETLFHVLGFCIYRVLILKNAHYHLNRKFLFYYVPVLWILIPVLLSLPFILWGQVGETVTFCSLDTLFRSNYNRSLGYIVSFFWGPVILTNALYLFLQVVLLKRIKRIYPGTRDRGLGSIDGGNTSNQGSLIQIRTLRTIGLVLLLLDVLTLPTNLAILLEVSMDSISLSRKQRFLITSLTYFNSAVNPFIYATQIPELRACMVKSFRVFWQRMLNVTRS